MSRRRFRLRRLIFAVEARIVTGAHRCPASTPANSADAVANPGSTRSSDTGSIRTRTERVCWSDLEAFTLTLLNE